MGASTTQLSKLDAVQNVATKSCETSFVPFWCRHHAAAVGLLFKLLDCHCHELLHTFYLNFSTLSLKLH